MTALYILTRILTFPGVYARCFWEQIVCRICKVPVEDNRYLRDDELSSHIDHELMPTARSAFAICFVPAFFNAIGAFILAIFPVAYLFIYETTELFAVIVCSISYWFACSLFLNSYSLIEDALNMIDKIYKHGNILQKIFYAPAAALLYVGSYLERYCVTFICVIVTAVILVFLI